MPSPEMATNEFRNTSKPESGRVVGREDQLNPDRDDVLMRIFGTVIEQFPARIISWVKAYMLGGLGLVLLENPHLFVPDPPASGNAFAHLLRIMPQIFWGYLCIVLGGARALVLLFEGLFPSPEAAARARLVTTFLSLFVWFNMVLDIIGFGRPYFMLPIYSGIIFVELYQVYRQASSAYAKGSL